MARTLNIGLLGLGNVGSGLVELIDRNGEVFEERAGVKLKIKRALGRDLKKPRPSNGMRLTIKAGEILDDPGIDLVVELLGGIEPARTLVLDSLEHKKHVVTANKALLAEHGDEIFNTAEGVGRSVGFEASICGGIPLIRTLTDGLIANRIESISGILNGTSNYILTRMHRDHLDFKCALEQAQALGFAEPDPTMDITGIDAAQKLAILCGLAFGCKPSTAQIPIQGIDEIDPEDVGTAKELGYVIKLLAYCQKANGGYDMWVRPVFVPENHPLANVNDENNAVLMRGDAVGELMLYGKGAGRLPTASAVLSDILSIARSQTLNFPKKSDSAFSSLVSPRSRYYLRFPIPDRPGAIGKIGTVLGQHGISISHALATLVNPDKSEGQVKILTHKTSEILIDRALTEIDLWPELIGGPIAIRIFE